MRYDAYVALLNDSLSEHEVLFGFGFVKNDAFRLCYRQIRSFRDRLSLKRSLSKNFNVCIRALELEWAKISV